MTIFQLECYYALAQSLNFTLAANRQFITQQALSRSIAALEKEINFGHQRQSEIYIAYRSSPLS